MRKFMRFTVLVVVLALLASGPTYALEQKLVVLTSFRADQTDDFKRGFESKFPGVKVELLNKDTPAGLRYLQETAGNNQTDLFWASAPDAFEVLKESGLLEKYTPKTQEIPEKIGAYPINDPDGYYVGFAATGYGIMSNVKYLWVNGLPEPREWTNLTHARYSGHVAMSAPSRSGTTHVIVETVLQGEGWDEGWAIWKQIGGNLATITERSFDVPEGVDSGSFGVGLVVDMYGLSSEARGFPVDFVYPTKTALLPANIALVKNAPHPEAAKAFIEYLLSSRGQRDLLKGNVLRLPVNPFAYVNAPSDFPNPFKRPIGAALRFEVKLSRQRYEVVNSLFDAMITHRLEALKEVTKSIREAQIALKTRPNAEAAELVNQARKLVATTPITAEEASDPALASIFQSSTTAMLKRRAEIQHEWDEFAKKNYADAKVKAKKALSLIR